ncbi:helix-turn-helix transcriptional regulator [Actinopolymorpha pittospori]|uniref:helix-turn-helix transcriptional regulator n=1 Tax=Actinopolymorpha pittospori TaxID=648752 RepID=UPI003B587CCA
MARLRPVRRPRGLRQLHRSRAHRQHPVVPGRGTAADGNGAHLEPAAAAAHPTERLRPEPGDRRTAQHERHDALTALTHPGRRPPTDLPRHPQPFLGTRPLDTPSLDRPTPSRGVSSGTSDGKRTSTHLDPRGPRRRDRDRANHLVRLFQRDLGVPPIAYLNRLRGQAAARLLVQTDAPISHIGVRVGWDDAGYFARRFKTAYGLSPSAYRSRALTGATRHHSSITAAEPRLPVSGARFDNPN